QHEKDKQALSSTIRTPNPLKYTDFRRERLITKYFKNHK
ncbi:unnamed protein product, partial [marine sediment metagenome]